MKKTIIFILAVCSFSILFAAGTSESVMVSETDTSPGKLVNNSFYVGPKVRVSDQSLNDLSMEELYEKALQEKGKIVIYSITSRISKIVEEFNKAYPGLQVEGVYVNNADLKSKVSIEADSRNVNADVVIASDATGQIYYEFYEKKYVEAYYPTKVTRHLSENDLTYGMPLYVHCDLWYYNKKNFDACPINNIWDLLDVDENGKAKWVFYTQDLTRGDALGIFAQFTADSENLAKAYRDKFGKDIVYTYNSDSIILGLPENNAGYEYIYRLAKLPSLTIIDKPDDRILAIHNSTGGAPVVGNAPGSKMSKDIDNNWGTLAWVTQANPSACYIRPTYIYLTSGTDNPAGARLFIYYAVGGDDPSNSKGLSQLLAYGSWTARKDYVDRMNDIPLSAINYSPYDLQGVYENYLDMCDAWIYWFDKFQR